MYDGPREGAAMIVLKDYEGVPLARCTEHGTQIAPLVMHRPGKLTVEWKCPICDLDASTREKSGTIAGPDSNLA